MKRFVRWTWNLLFVLSLLLTAAVLILWYQSYHARNVVWMRNRFAADGLILRTDWFICDRGRLGWSRHEAPGIWRTSSADPNRKFNRWWVYAREDYSTRWNYGWELTTKDWPHISQRLRTFRFLGFEFQQLQSLSDRPSYWTRFGFTIAAPCSFLTLLLGTPPLIRILRTVRRYRRRARNACPACGYDLRATPNQCPECGARLIQPDGPSRIDPVAPTTRS